MSQKTIVRVTVVWGIIAVYLLFSGPLTLLNLTIILGYVGYLLAVYPGERERFLVWMSLQLGGLPTRTKQPKIVVSSATSARQQELAHDFPLDFPEDTQPIKPVIIPAPLSAPVPPRSGINVYTIKLPKGGEYRPDLAYALVQKLTSLGQLALRIMAADNSVRWQVVDVSERHEPSLIVHAIRSVYPDATVEVTDLEWQPVTAPFHRLTIFF